MYVSDTVIVGSGIAGLFAAIKLARSGTVTVLTKDRADEANTRYAQGGIASVLSESDSFDAHIADTLKTGAGLSNRDVVTHVVESGPQMIRALCELGVEFSEDADTAFKNSPAFSLGLEGGHSHRRILHAGDQTGEAIELALLRAVRAHPKITLKEHHIAIDLIVRDKHCVGVYALNCESKSVEAYAAKVVLLASGGAGKVYLYTSNPDIATGDGMAMAKRAGCSLVNMEMVQFHPTCLYHPQAKSFLISEAVRGEGAILKNRLGQRFMEAIHPLKELAPRDIVARAIDAELKKSGAEHVWLDISHQDAAFIRTRFPAIYQTCLKFGFDMTREPIPVVPAAHYFCGGVSVNLKGETEIENLYAIGEVAHTGLHGANRLASNSLLEAVVFAHAAVQAIQSRLPHLAHRLDCVPEWDSSFATESGEQVVITQNWDEIRRLMWNYVGIVRSTARLARAKRRIDLLRDEIREYYWNYIVTKDLIELRNLATVAEAVIDAALSRKESRGLHYTTDYPEMLTRAEDTVV